MNLVVQQKIDRLAEICKYHHVRSLALFGSATGEQFDPQTSDIDLLVEFEPARPSQYADNFFGLQDALQQLFGLRVELVEKNAVRNPIFQQVIEETKVPLYDAA